MTGGAGAVVRTLTSAGNGTLETYRTHVANTFAIWFNPARVVGGSVRFVVRSNGRVTDVSIDSFPRDSISRREFEMKLRNIPFMLDPLPPPYPAEAVALQATFVLKCHSPRTALFWAQPTTFTPLPDGLIELANIHPSWKSIWDTREQPPSRDVVTPAALTFFLDTTATLLPSENGKFPPVLDRWSGSLAEVPILGYRGELKGLVLGLGTQGQLHGNINCGQETGEWINSLDVSISRLTKPSAHTPPGMRRATRSPGCTAIIDDARRYRAKSNAEVRSPAPSRTPGNGSSSKRRVMNLRIDVVSDCV